MSSPFGSPQPSASGGNSNDGSANKQHGQPRPQFAASSPASQGEWETRHQLANNPFQSPSLRQAHRRPGFINSLRSLRPTTPTSPSQAPSSPSPSAARRSGRPRSHNVEHYPWELSQFLHHNPPPAPVPSPGRQASLPATFNLTPSPNHQLSQTEASPPINHPLSTKEASSTDTTAHPVGFLRRATSVFKKPHSRKTDTSATPSSSSGPRAIVRVSSRPIITITAPEEPAQIEHSPHPPPLVISHPYIPSPSFFAARSSDSQDTIRPKTRSGSQVTIRPASPSTIKMPTAPTNQQTASTGVQLVPLACPPWDRRVDVKWSRDRDITWSGATELTAFRTSVAVMARTSGHMPTSNEVSNPLCRLPDRIRYMICKYLVGGDDNDDDGKPIRLNTGTWLYKDVWAEGTFESLEAALGGLASYTRVCYTLRTDVLATLFNTRRFHVVVSPFPLAKLDPMSHVWFGRYGGYLQFLTIEVDFARLGMGKEPGAALLTFMEERLESRLEAYGAAQKSRALYQKILLDRDGFFGDGGRTAKMAGGAAASRATTVHDLTVIVRRYFGNRPRDAGRAPTKYSDDKYLAVLEPLGRGLHGKVDHLRVVGTSIPAANDLIASVWDGGDGAVLDDPEEWARHSVRFFGPSFYPSLPGQASVLVDADEGEYYFRHPGAFHGVRDYVLDEAAVRGQLEVGPPEAAGRRRDKGKGKEKEGPLGAAGSTISRGSSTSTEPFPEVPSHEVQWRLLAMQGVEEAIKRVSARLPEEGGDGAEKGKGRMRQFSGKLQERVSRLVSKDKSSKDSDGKE